MRVAQGIEKLEYCLCLLTGSPYVVLRREGQVKRHSRQLRLVLELPRLAALQDGGSGCSATALATQPTGSEVRVPSNDSEAASPRKTLGWGGMESE
jgi:hypothetical protein